MREGPVLESKYPSIVSIADIIHKIGTLSFTKRTRIGGSAMNKQKKWPRAVIGEQMSVTENRTERKQANFPSSCLSSSFCQFLHFPFGNFFREYINNLQQHFSCQ
jgi:hypothetical protein